MALRASLAASLGARRGARGRRALGEQALSLLLAGAAVALLAGVVMRAPDPTVGFSVGATLAALAGQLPVTGPAALAVSGGMVVELIAGTAVMRLLRGSPFRSWPDALLEGYAGAVFLDLVLLFGPGGVGWFRGPLIAALLGSIVLAGTRFHPIVQSRRRRSRPHLGRWAVVVLVWCAPLVLTLASPVVPFGDLLPNHVAPAEHLRAFGSFTPLTINPSPTYGTTRLFLGYIGLLGSLATLANLPAALAVASFAVPLTVLSAIAIRRLATAAFGRQAGYWALLAFPLSYTFVRLTDARDSVTALPLGACALAILLEERGRGPVAVRGSNRATVVLAVPLATTILVHPLVGAFTVATVAAMALVDPARYARLALPALLAACIAALPEAGVMLGTPLPPASGLLALAGAGLVAVGGAGLFGRWQPSPRWVQWAARLRRPAAVVSIVAGVIVVLAIVEPALLTATIGRLQLRFPVLFAGAVLGLLGIAPSVRAGRLLLVVSLGVGLCALLVAGLVPGSSLTAQSVRYEVAKAVAYWLPWASVPVVAGLLAALWRWRGPLVVPLLATGVFLIALLLPIGGPAPDALQASHPVADLVAYDLHTAEHGYWQGYPDPRLVLDGPERQIVEFLQGEEQAGRLRAGDAVLHVARTHQEWGSVPVGVFTGAIETFVCADASPTVFTLGNRFLPLTDLAGALTAHYRYVLLEPAGLPPGARGLILAAGYRPVFANARGEVFAASGA